MKIRIVWYCGDCKTHWDDQSGEPAGCANLEHDHQRFDVHVHRSKVTLPDGTDVTAVSWVRENYCTHAVETDQQRLFVEHFEV